VVGELGVEACPAAVGLASGEEDWLGLVWAEAHVTPRNSTESSNTCRIRNLHF
jgi:hypothetical protein